MGEDGSAREAGATADEKAPADGAPAEPIGAERIRDIIAVVILSITAVLTAWSGFESSKWGGEMSISFSKASTARIEASREAERANAARGYDLDVFGIYVQALASDDQVLADFAEERFSDAFRPAFDEWIAMEPLQNPDAPKSPFALDAYQPPGQQEAAEADARADELFQTALRNNQRGDNYTLLTVLFALVLFFTSVSGRPKLASMRWFMLGLAVTLAIVGAGFLAAFPKII
ncbi:MAG: hypothetical protein KQH57_04755 [Actinomycetales bacterium]|nr:hypothetical protein [Actinomycetales bacterium]